jgi:hypothetical protein
MGLSKGQIIEEVKRTAEANGGVPLGVARFQKETGMKGYDWAKYWPKYSDLLRDAGLAPNSLTTGYGEEFLLEKVVTLIRELGRFPTGGDLRVKSYNDSEFPSKTTIEKIGNRLSLVNKVCEYSKRKGYADVIQHCETVIESKRSSAKDIVDGTVHHIGEVYLFKSGRYYKIGKTIDTVRRGAELRVQLPESLNLVHSIRTDDPSGVEAYWHRRFESKRKNGEWFDLSSSEVKSFKAWKRIV